MREDRPNEDAVACSCGESGRWAITAVADGHGHSLAVRADAGARLAVDIGLAAARSCIAAMEPAPETTDPAVADRLARDIAANWMGSVEQHLAENPFTDAELRRSSAAETLATHPEAAYGTTLLVALAVGSSIVTCQIGDGDLLAVTADGGIFTLVPPDKRLVGTKTTSLASRTATNDFRSNLVDVGRERIEVVVAATDGYVNSFSADDGFATAGRDLWKLIHDVGPASVEGALASWLESTSADGTGDDATLALLFDEAGLAGDSDPGSAATIPAATLTTSEGASQ